MEQSKSLDLATIESLLEVINLAEDYKIYPAEELEKQRRALYELFVPAVDVTEFGIAVSEDLLTDWQNVLGKVCGYSASIIPKKPDGLVVCYYPVNGCENNRKMSPTGYVAFGTTRSKIIFPDGDISGTWQETWERLRAFLDSLP